MPPVHPRRPTASASFATALALGSLLFGSLLGGCGGGGSDAPSTAAPASTSTAAAVASTARPSNDVTTQHAATATSAGRNAVSLLEGSLVSARALLVAHAASAATTATASPAAIAIPCPAGGSARVSLQNIVASALPSAPWATGGDYAFDLSACRFEASAAPLSGALAVHVLSATGSDASVTMTLNALSIGGAGGTSTLTGSASVQITQADGAAGSHTQTLRISSPALTLSTLSATGVRGEFALTGAAFLEESRSVNGVLGSTRMTASHQLTASLPIGSFSYAVATLGDVVSSAAGVPQSGGWRFSFGGIRVDVTVSGATVQVAVDLDANGSPEFSFTLPSASLFGSVS